MHHTLLHNRFFAYWVKMLIESEEVLDKTEESNDAQIDQQPETSKAWPLYNAKDHAEKVS